MKKLPASALPFRCLNLIVLVVSFFLLCSFDLEQEQALQKQEGLTLTNVLNFGDSSRKIKKGYPDKKNTGEQDASYTSKDCNRCILERQKDSMKYEQTVAILEHELAVVKEKQRFLEEIASKLICFFWWIFGYFVVKNILLESIFRFMPKRSDTQQSTN